MLINVTLLNEAIDDQPLNSLVQFSLKDNAGNTYSERPFLKDAQLPDPIDNGHDNKVPAAESVNGTMVYEIPLSQKTFTFAFQETMDGSAQVTWTISL